MSKAEPKQMTVFGGFKTIEGANVAADRLIREGIPRESIGIVMSEEARRRLGTVKSHTKAAEGFAAGSIGGGVLGALATGLTTVAAIAAPGVGLLAAGPIVAMFAGLGAGAAAGGAVGGLIGLGMAEHEVKPYTDLLRDHGVLVGVTTNSKEVRDRARQVLSASGAIEIETRTGPTAQM